MGRISCITCSMLFITRCDKWNDMILSTLTVALVSIYLVADQKHGSPLRPLLDQSNNYAPSENHHSPSSPAQSDS